MKKFTILAVFLLVSTVLIAQSIEITPLFGYMNSGKVESNYGKYDVKNDISYGASMDVGIDDGIYVELSYR